MSSQVSSSVLSDLFTEDLNEDILNTSAPTSSAPACRKRKRNTSRRSWVWDHLPDSEGGRDTIWTNNARESIWKCKLYSKAYKESAGTRNITQHLETHNIYDGKEQSLARQATIRHAFERGQEASHTRRRLNSDTNGATLDPGTLEQLFAH
jgi:hypothetical protein